MGHDRDLLILFGYFKTVFFAPVQNILTAPREDIKCMIFSKGEQTGAFFPQTRENNLKKKKKFVLLSFNPFPSWLSGALLIALSETD